MCSLLFKSDTGQFVKHKHNCIICYCQELVWADYFTPYEDIISQAVVKHFVGYGESNS